MIAFEIMYISLMVLIFICFCVVYYFSGKYLWAERRPKPPSNTSYGVQPVEPWPKAKGK